jgi:hypothetical protein
MISARWVRLSNPAISTNIISSRIDADAISMGEKINVNVRHPSRPESAKMP